MIAFNSLTSILNIRRFCVNICCGSSNCVYLNIIEVEQWFSYLGPFVMDQKALSLLNILAHILHLFAFLFCSGFLFFKVGIFATICGHIHQFFSLCFLLLLCSQSLWAPRACTFHPLFPSFSTDIVLHSIPSYIWNSFCCVMSGTLWIVLASVEYSFLSWIDLELFSHLGHSDWTSYNFIKCLHIWGEVFPLFWNLFGCLCLLSFFW